MTKRPIPHPTLLTPRLRLRQFQTENSDAMPDCFTDPEAIPSWNVPVRTK